MFKNYFKIALRNLLKHKGVSFINISGLAVGIACSLLIILFVQDELSYDRYHKDADRIYRVVKDFVNDDGSKLPDATTPAALGPAIQRNIAEVAHVTRVFPPWGDKFLVQYGDKKFMEERLYRIDSSFFDVFTFPFVKGDARSAFKDVNAVLLTERTAEKYFGKEDPIGKIIRVDRSGDLIVSGVLKDVPENSHFHFDLLVSIRKINWTNNVDENWGWYNFYTYMKLRPHVQMATVARRIQSLYKTNNPEGKSIFYAQALPDIHLNSQLKWEIEPTSDKLYVYIFSIIALLVITIACVNYVNLSTAKSSLRAKEIGIRKVAGAFKMSLIKQFLLESVITVFLAFLLALLLAQLLLPVVNHLTQKQLSLLTLATPFQLLLVLLFVIITGLAAGIYPALYLSSFRPVLVLKGLALSERKTFSLRKVLVILQFAISVALTVGSFVIIQQLSFIRHSKLGLDKDQVLIIEDAGSLARSGRETLQSEFLKVKGVKKASTANGIVGGQNWTINIKLKGATNGQLLNFIGVGYDYLNVLGITMKEGRKFSADFPGDSLSSSTTTVDGLAGSVILNERAVRDLGIPSPVTGRLVSWEENRDSTRYLRIVGVVKDFHFASFKSEIKPFGFVINHNWQTNFTLKVDPANISKTLAGLQEKWADFVPERPFRYSFLDETFASLYKAEERFNKVVICITILAIAIACMGLFGLTTFIVERRTREIGVRKIVGSSVFSIVALLSRDFVKMVVIAFLFACPVAWFFMNRWLQNFAYHTKLSWWIFPLAGAIAVLVTIFTISYQAIKAALMNPLKALRSD